MSDNIIDRCVSSVRSKELTQYKDIVIEVIKQIREPNEAMINAALNDYLYREKNKQPWNGRTMYHAMIDEILDITGINEINKE